MPKEKSSLTRDVLVGTLVPIATAVGLVLAGRALRNSNLVAPHELTAAVTGADPVQRLTNIMMQPQPARPARVPPPAHETFPVAPTGPFLPVERQVPIDLPGANDIEPWAGQQAVPFLPDLVEAGDVDDFTGLRPETPRLEDGDDPRLLGRETLGYRRIRQAQADRRMRFGPLTSDHGINSGVHKGRQVQRK